MQLLPDGGTISCFGRFFFKKEKENESSLLEEEGRSLCSMRLTM